MSKHNYNLSGVTTLIFGFCLFFSLPVYSLNLASDPCSTPVEIFALVDRPSRSDSACTVPYKKFMIEMGYEYLNLTSDIGFAHSFPEIELRLGLPLDNELFVIMPNYNVQSTAPKTGYNATTVGLKHKLAYTDIWVAAIEGLVTLPSGSAAFGSEHFGGTINGIFTYNLTSVMGLTMMVGVSSYTLPSYYGGARFSSFNPDVLLSYLINERISIYLEAFGQTNAGPGLGSGYIADAGVLFLVNKHMEIDFSAGQRLSGQLDLVNNYVGLGMSFLIG